MIEGKEMHILDFDNKSVIEPEVKHHIMSLGEVVSRVEFYK